MSFLTARWHIGTWHSLQASVCVFSDRTMAVASTAAPEDTCPLLLEKNMVQGERDGDTSRGWGKLLFVFLYHHDSAGTFMTV